MSYRGTHLSEDSKAKIRESALNRPKKSMSEETKKKIAASRRGKKLSTSTREKMSMRAKERWKLKMCGMMTEQERQNIERLRVLLSCSNLQLCLNMHDPTHMRVMTFVEVLCQEKKEYEISPAHALLEMFDAPEEVFLEVLSMYENMTPEYALHFMNIREQYQSMKR